MTGIRTTETRNRAWVIRRPGPIDTGPMAWVDRPAPRPAEGEIGVRVSVCGVCRTDLHLAEGDLAPRHADVVPGHEIVGVVDELGPGAARFAVGERVGVAWLGRTCGLCRFCLRGDENLCLAPRFTGWDHDGGYGTHTVADERFAYRLPDAFPDEQAAPLLCAGIVGFRALRRAELPPGGTLGIYGFGASAHLVAQVAMAEGATVYVFTRSSPARSLARELGAAWAGDSFDRAPTPLDSAVVFAPAGEIIPAALAATDAGGTVAVAGIHLSDIPSLNYAEHLFSERQLRSVTANTRGDGEDFLAIAARIALRVETVPYPLEHADEALADLARGRVNGAAVLVVDSG